MKKHQSYRVGEAMAKVIFSGLTFAVAFLLPFFITHAETIEQAESSFVEEYSITTNPSQPSAGFAGEGTPPPDQGQAIYAGYIQPEVSEFNGSMTYSYPLDIPQGRNGLTPNIGLHYNSSNKSHSSLVGYGWTLDVPYIQRLNKEGSEKLYTDDYFTSSLDGELVDQGSGLYTPRVENGSFIKYQYANDIWTLTDKTGVVYKFGKTTQARQSDPANSSNIYTWMLEEVTDTNGNTIEYEYFKDAGQIYPDVIKYNQNHFFEIQFDYQAISGGAVSYAPGFKQQTNYRLDSIDISVNTSLTSFYEIQVTDNLVTQITKTGVDGINTLALPSVEFSYDDGVADEFVKASTEVPSYIDSQSVKRGLTVNDAGRQYIDINGDGLLDLVSSYGGAFDSSGNQKAPYGIWFNNGNGFTKSSMEVPSYVDGSGNKYGRYVNDLANQYIDINGDGLLDFVSSYNGAFDSSGNQKAPYGIWINDGSSFTKSSMEVPSYIDSSGNKQGRYVQDSVNKFIDIDGDGLVDFISSYNDAFDTTTGAQLAPYGIWINDGSSFTKSSIEVPSYIDAWGDKRGRYVNDTMSQYIDINGDGLLDLVSSHNEAFDVVSGNPVSKHGIWLNDGNSFTKSSIEVPSYIDAWGDKRGLYVNSTTARYIDINGDGLPDLVSSSNDAFDTSGNLLNHHGIWLNTGSGFTKSTIEVPSYVDGSGDKYGRYVNNDASQYLDLNGDGLLDLIVSIATAFDSSGNQKDPYGIWFNNGNGFTKSTIEVPSYLDGSGNKQGRLVNDIANQYIDINGDGLLDLVSSYHDAFDTSGDLMPQHGIWKNTATEPVIYEIDNGVGGTTDFEYTNLRQFTDSNGIGLNYNLPRYFQNEVLSEMTTNDGNGVIATTSYEYAGADYYYNSSDREQRFAGFATVTEERPDGSLSITKYHQNNGQQGNEPTDSYAKIGKVYQHTITDASGNIFKQTRMNYAENSLGNGAVSIQNESQLQQQYDGNSSHVDTAIGYTYDSYGNITQEIQYGTVSGNTNGTFTDTGSDKRTVKTAYTTNTSAYIVGLPIKKTLKDYANNNVSVTDITYDTNGNPTKKSQWISGLDYADTDYTYNSYGLVLTETNPNNHTTTYTYDTYNLYPETVTNALGQDIDYLYDYSSGQVRSTIDDNGNTELVTYDPLDRPIEIKRTVGNSTTPSLVESFVYNTTASPQYVKRTKHYSASSAQDIYEYLDGFGRTIQTKSEMDSNYQTLDTIYNTMGQVEKQSLPYSTSSSANSSATTTSSLLTTNSYDALGRITQSVNAKGTTSTSYNGFLTTITDALSNSKELVTDAFGNLASVTEDAGGSNIVTNYSYNAQNLLTHIVDGSNNERSISYDGLGRRLSMTDLHATSDLTYGIWNFLYNDMNLVSQTDPNGTTLNYTYDNLERITIEDDPSTLGVTEISYSYDLCTNGIGHICTVTTPSVTTSYIYHDAGTIDSETKTIAGTGYTTSYDYNYQGAVTDITYPNTDTVEYLYNTRGLQKELKYNTTSLGTMSYGVHGRPVAQTHSNGVSSSYTYDAANLYELTNKTTLDGGLTVLQDLDYEYDAVGNITKITDAGAHNGSQIQNFTYDDLYRLTQAAVTNTGNSADYTRNYTYNDIGNITAFNGASYTYTDLGYTNPHAVTQIGTTNLTYDNNGNMTTDGTWTHTWNYNNTLAQSTDGVNISSYLYDHNKDRVQLDESGTVTQYPNPSYEVTAGVQKLSLSLGNTFMATIDDAGGLAVTNHIHTDHLNGTQLTTNNTGAISKLLDYYPYGDTRIDTGVNNEQKQYTGYTKDSSTGLHYAGARYYTAGVGRFLSQDPVALMNPSKVLEDPQQLNMYSYARNNPVIFVDPDGEQAMLAGALMVTSMLVKPQQAYAPGMHESFTQPLTDALYQINYASTADSSMVSDFTKHTIQDAMFQSNENSILVTSTIRTPEKQATIMYNNAQQTGIQYQLNLYGNYGDQVVNMYPDLQKMIDKIYEIGPSNVSSHLRDPNKVNVLDIAPSSVINKDLFTNALNSNSNIGKLITPPADTSYHLEISQPTKEHEEE